MMEMDACLNSQRNSKQPRFQQEPFGKTTGLEKIFRFSDETVANPHEIRKNGDSLSRKEVGRICRMKLLCYSGDRRRIGSNGQSVAPR